MKRIQKIEARMPQLKKKKRVAAYARVSVAKGRTLNSLSQQVSYYNKLISNNKDWEFAGVFSDLGVSGASANREGFQEILEACEEGKIDLILTKSISRFGRNTLDLLEIVRHLKSTPMSSMATDGMERNLILYQKKLKSLDTVFKIS